MDEQAPEKGSERPDRAPSEDERSAIDLREEWRSRNEGTTFRERLDRPDRYGVLLVLIAISLISIAVFSDGEVERAFSVAILGVTLVFAGICQPVYPIIRFGAATPPGTQPSAI